MIILAWGSEPMARDNAACNRAIRQAWKREKELVLAEKGSRNWTPEQREQLITKGKVYDADGKAFIGQHMKSVSGYPDNQGDADNIQLLSQEEHLEAHKGDWHNITNWYYDPDTKTFYDFDEYDFSKFPPDDYCNFHPEECRVSVEVVSEEPPKEKSKESTESEKKVEETLTPQKTKVIENNGGSDKSKVGQPPSPSIDKLDTTFEKAAQPQKTMPKPPKREKKLGRVLKAVGRFIVEHPVESIEIAGAAIGGAVKIVQSISSSKNNGNSISQDTSSTSSVKSDIVTQVEEIIEKASRSSPREHDVSGYDRQQNGRTVHVNPYKRGGNKPNND